MVLQTTNFQGSSKVYKNVKKKHEFIIYKLWSHSMI